MQTFSAGNLLKVLQEHIRCLAPSSGTSSIRSTSEPPWIIHVDDDAEFSNALKQRLEAHGVVVVRAFDGMDGLDYVSKYPPDAILLDLAMPNGTGDEVLRALKHDSSTKDIPVLVLTCSHGLSTKRRMQCIGAAGYLTKPLDFQLLHWHLSKYVDILPISPSTPTTIMQPDDIC